MKIVFILMLLLLSSYAFAETDDMIDSIQTSVGKTFVITLDADATTGYEWQPASPIDDIMVNLVRTEYVPNNTGLVGSGDKSIWTFRAVRAGKVRMPFKYIRPLEKDAPPAKKATYIVDIQE